MGRTLTRRRSRDEEDEDYYAEDTDDYEGDEDEVDEDEDRPRRGSKSRKSRSRERESSPRRPKSRSRGRERDRDEDRGSRKRSKSRSSGRGWDAHERHKARTSKFDAGNEFKVEKGKKELIKFLEDVPFYSWLEHWVDEIDVGKKSHYCLDSNEEDPGDCPLCDVGLKKAERAAFNIVTFDKKGNPVVKYWIATPDPLGSIDDARSDKMTSPIDREDLYFAVSKSSKGRRTSYKVEAVDEDKVEKYFDIDPLTDDEIDDLRQELFGEDDVVRRTSRSDLEEIVEEYLDD